MKLYTDRNLGSGSNSGAVRDQHHVLHHCAPEFFYIYHLFRIISRSAQNDDKTGLNLKPIYAPSCIGLMGGGQHNVFNILQEYLTHGKCD